MDSEKEFFKALGGGSVYQPYSLVTFLATLANPFSKARLKSSLGRDKEVVGNMTGEGFIS